MVRFVVEHHYPLLGHQLWHHSLKHLPFGFQSFDFLATPLKKRSAGFAERHALSQLECVIVGDDDFGFLQIWQHVARNQLAAAVVAVGIVGKQHTQAVSDGDARSDHQKTLGEPSALGMANGVDSLPCDEHCHDSGLA